MTAGTSSVTEAVSHFPIAWGSRRRLRMSFFAFFPGAVITSSGTRGAGAASYTQASSAIRLRPLFSPGDSRVASLFRDDAAAFAVAGRSASGRMTIPLPSQVTTSTCSSGAGPGLRLS